LQGVRWVFIAQIIWSEQSWEGWLIKETDRVFQQPCERKVSAKDLEKECIFISTEHIICKKKTFKLLLEIRELVKTFH
jgi:hypothetical protein